MYIVAPMLMRSIAAVLLLSCVGFAQATPEQRAARHMESLRGNQALLNAFLRKMPKGGDLHNHLIGAVYAENMVQWAADDGLCVDRATAALLPPPCDDAAHPPAAAALRDPNLYRQMIEAFSMRHWSPGEHRSGIEHFFTTFGKFVPATRARYGDMLAEVARRNAAQNLFYVELIHDMEQGEAAALSQGLQWSDDLATMHRQLQPELPAVIARSRQALDQAEARMRELLRCGTPQADPGCRVTIRYIAEVLRALPREHVFAEAVVSFALAQADPRIVSVNPVMPEDDYVAIRDFPLHLRIFDYLHGQYSGVKATIHAGELALGLVPPESLRFHIRDSIERGHARRIGHGVDILYEDGWEDTMGKMARERIAVEICLTSNDFILGVRGSAHPLRAYMQRGVPVMLATDDEGVSRSDITNEILRGVLEQRLTYSELKQMARNSLEYAFVQGESLWRDGQFRPAGACAADRPGSEHPSGPCRKLLDSSQKARLQWDLEARFSRFESRF